MITVKNLQYKYPKSSDLTIRGIDFSIAQGEVFGFLGPSGSGKSTTQKILFRLLQGYEGIAEIEGKEVKDWNKDLYAKIGVSFELPNHYLKLTALENLNFFKAFYPKSLDPMELLESVGLKEAAHQRVSDYSKGMKMRLNFVRALLHDPEILFLDEPTSGLDPAYGRMMKDIILDLKAQGKTIFITTHKMYDADELCDRVAFIVEGQIETEGSPAALKLMHSHHKVEVKMQGEKELHVFDLPAIGQNQAFLALINSGEVETIHSKEATLDEVFLSVTGKSLL